MTPAFGGLLVRCDGDDDSGRRNSFWECWCCGSRNQGLVEVCGNCSRARFPEWLELPSGSILPGKFLQLHRNECKMVAFVSRVDYRNKSIELYTSGNASSVPKRELFSAKELSRLDAMMIPASSEAAKMMASFFLCKECGAISKLSCGGVFLDEKERGSLRAEHRMKRKQLEPLQQKYRYLTRKWRETKSGFHELSLAKKAVESNRKETTNLMKKLELPQLWCTACGWSGSEASNQTKGFLGQH